MVFYTCVSCGKKWRKGNSRVRAETVCDDCIEGLNECEEEDFYDAGNGRACSPTSSLEDGHPSMQWHSKLDGMPFHPSL